MPVQTNIPQVAVLRVAVEKCFGHKVESRSDITLLGSDIEHVTNEHLAENTLRRLWGRIKGYGTTHIRTLDVLCRYIGFAHWDAFCCHLKQTAQPESNIVRNHFGVKVEDLVPGDRIRIGWLPDRVCIVEFQGGRTFKAIDCQNSTLQNGDSFECRIMLKNSPLFVDSLVHGGELCQSYLVGLDGGLTILDKL
jgi:hypothetical protein